jgi:hypothetical protein
VLGPTDRTVSRGSDTSAETGGACVSGSGGYCIIANCSGKHERKHADVVGPDARKVYNTAQVQSQRARFTSATIKNDEAVEEFAERLRQLACGLSDDVLLLMDGLPSALKVNALAMTGDFDTVVSQVGQIADAMAAQRPRRGQVNAVGGASEYTNGKRKGMSHNVGTSHE